MVEDNNSGQEHGRGGAKKISRLFGVRRAAKRAAQTPTRANDAADESRAPQPPTEDRDIMTQIENPRESGPSTEVAPSESAETEQHTAAEATEQVTEATASVPEDASVADAPGTPGASDASVPAVVDEPATSQTQPFFNALPVTPVVDGEQQKRPPLPTTSLVFVAPELPPFALPQRAGQRGDAFHRDGSRREDGHRIDFRDEQRRAALGREAPSRDARDPRDSREFDRERPARPERGRREPFDRDEEQAPTLRRRARRRPGDEGRSDDPENTVVRVRQTREPELITEPQRVKGSTRLEAKKQRRRDGRDAGRRRTVVTEAEFLARRESVDRTMIVRSKNNRIQIGVLEDGVLAEHYVARSQEASLIGNVYLGRVQNVLPSMEAAFVDIGRGRNAVLYSGEVDWDAAEAGQPRRIELALKPGDKVLVQVTKDPVGHKGARLTSQVSLPGRYLVYVPNGSMSGISRKLPDNERARLKKILKEVLPENVGVIVRTAAEGATEEQLTVDVERLTGQWAAISEKVKGENAPALLHSEPDLLIKIVRDVFNEDFEKMVIAGDDARETIELYLSQVAPDLLERVESYTGERDAFDEFRITEQIEKALDRKVWLPSGGSLVIDRTEAMTVVDVNTGKFVGSGGNLEETVTKNNLEAAEEIVRQLRLRDIGGIIVVDFIDMVLESNRDLVLRRLIECLSRDRTKHQVAEVTSLGLVQMTRKKLGLGLLETFSENCEVCAGRGIIVHHDPVVKHRQTQQPQPERRPRTKSGTGSQGTGSNGSGQNGGSNGRPVTNTATHAITDDAKNALAQIAASTIHPHAPAAETGTGTTTETVVAAIVSTHTEPASASVTDAPESSSDDVAVPARAEQQGTAGDAVAGETSVGGGTDARAERQGRRQRDRQDGRRSGRDGREQREPRERREPSADRAADLASVLPPAAARADEPTVPILDLPVAASKTAQRRLSTHAAEQLLDSVLEALPAPRQPGQGRAKSRRVTTAALTGVAVVPEATRPTE